MKFVKSMSAVLACILLVFAILVSRYEAGTDRAGKTTAGFSPRIVAEQAASVGDSRVGELYRQKQSGVFVTVTGRVVRLLADDNEGDRHQRFILELDSGQTLLISHNIDLAPRINNLEISDRVILRGEYEWNEKGGVIHWTHHDPDNRYAGGWIEHEGRRYH